MKTATKTAENGLKLIPHDGCTEWSVCGKCGTTIDWANEMLFGPESGRERGDTTCPHCGHEDTAWLAAPGQD